MSAAVRLGDPNPHSILVVLPTWVGDFVMATPALRALRTRYPTAHILFLLESNLRDVVQGGDWMNECVEWPPKTRRTPLHRAYRDLVWELRRRRFDWAVLFPNSFRAAMFARLAGARRRIGFDRDGRGFLLTDRIPAPNRVAGPARQGNGLAREGHGMEVDGPGSLHPPLPVTVRNAAYRPMPMVEYYAELVGYLDCARPADRLELSTTPNCEAAVEARLRPWIAAGDAGIAAEANSGAGVRMSDRGIAGDRPLVVISPGAKYGAAKCWFPERFAEVADRMIEGTGAVVAITCGPGEESLAEEIAARMRRRAIVLTDPVLSLGELKALVRRADLLLCTDSGPRHFAKAFGVPVVTLFGPTHPDWTATSHPAERIVRVDLECSPCQQRVCPLGHHECMKRITVDLVLSAIRELVPERRQAIAV